MSPADKTKALIPYLRQSRAKEKTISIDEQWRDIRTWAKRAGVKLADGIVEQNVSGSKHWKKRELGAAVETCHRGEASGIIVAYQSRLSRESGLGTAEVWEEFERAGLRLVCVAENIDTAREDDQEFNFGIQALIARQEWKRHARNWRKGKHAAWERGQYVAALPAGFDRTADGGLVPNEHAEVVRHAFELRAATPRASWGEVAQLFETAGILTSRGRTQWIPEGARAVLGNEVYTGLHTCTCGCGESVVRKGWEIVEGWLWRKAQQGKSPEKQTRTRGEGHPLGQGLVHCATCGTGLTKSTSPRGAVLRCRTRGPGHPAILYDPALEWIMLEAVRAIGPRRRDEGNDAEIEKAKATLAGARAELEALEESMGTVAPAESKQRLAVQDAEDALAGIEQVDNEFDFGKVLTPLGVKQHIETLPIPEQRRVLRQVIEKVVLSKERGAPWDRLTIYFKDGSVHPVPDGFGAPEAVAA